MNRLAYLLRYCVPPEPIINESIDELYKVNLMRAAKNCHTFLMEATLLVYETKAGDWTSRDRLPGLDDLKEANVPKYHLQLIKKLSECELATQLSCGASLNFLYDNTAELQRDHAEFIKIARLIEKALYPKEEQATLPKEPNIGLDIFEVATNIHGTGSI